MFKYCLIVMLGFLLWGCSNVEIKKEYYSNGRLKSEKQYKDGILNGESKEYSGSGRIISQEHWNNGNKDTVQYYRQDGIVIWIVYGDSSKIKDAYENVEGKPYHFNYKYGAIYDYLFNDTVTLGDTIEANVSLITANPDYNKKYQLFIGEIDTNKSMLIDEGKEVPMIRPYGTRYAFVPKVIGKGQLTGILELRISNGRDTLYNYPFRLSYFVKRK